MRRNALYFYIINNGSKEKAQRHEDKRRKLPEAKASPKLDFTFFFIWQAIVRGQLFLQWTFFLFISPVPRGTRNSELRTE